jgi:hypothetical protein
MKAIALLIVIAAAPVLAQDDGSPQPAPTPIPLPPPIKIVLPKAAAPAAPAPLQAPEAAPPPAPAPLQAPEVPAADVTAWQAVTAFLRTPPPKPNGNWLDAARIAMQTRIQREGYTHEVLAQATALMERARTGK